jgi:hypothetical protein
MEVRNLRAYLANIGVTLKDFAEAVECHPHHLSSIINGRFTAGHRLARDIFQATDGVVQVPTKKRKPRRKANEISNDQQNLGVQ